MLAKARAHGTPTREAMEAVKQQATARPPITGGATQLEKIDLSECPDVRARAIGAIARNCPDLKDLTLVGCVSVGDEACEALARYSTRLRHLDLSDCQRISERGVGAIGRNVTGLAKLNVTGCKKVGRRFLLDLIDELQFCDLARDYVGYQPKKNADWLRREAERRQRELGSIIKIQALFRGAVFRTGLGAYRRRVFFERCVTKLQACERARTWRKRVAAVALADREHRAATWFAAMYRGKIARRIVAQWRNQQASARKTYRAAMIMQRTVRAHRAKRRVESFRRAVEAMRLDAARLRARQEWRAVMLQAALRGMFARQEALRLKAIRDAKRAEEKARAEAALRIQAQYRASLGRDEATRRRDARAYRRWLWRTARKIQSWLRGCWGRMRAAAVRKAKADEIKNKMATKIQAAWRAAKSRYLATIQASLEALRAEEKVAVVRIQSSARAYFARNVVQRKREAKRLLELQGVAAALIQRILRGHYGRTAWEVAQRQLTLQDRAAPLYSRLNVLLDESREAADARDDATKAHAEAQVEVTQIEAELRELSRVGHDTWDTGRLSQGYVQRYKTSFLKHRIIELLANKRAAVVEFADMAREKTIVARDKARLIREVQREIRPLADGLAERTRRERVHRLRTNVRRNAAMATRLQKLTRGVVCRQAFDRLLLRGVDQWLVLECELSGDPYFYNRFTEERRDVRPLGIRLRRHCFEKGLLHARPHRPAHAGGARRRHAAGRARRRPREPDRPDARRHDAVDDDAGHGALHLDVIRRESAAYIRSTVARVVRPVPRDLVRGVGAAHGLGSGIRVSLSKIIMAGGPRRAAAAARRCRSGRRADISAPPAASGCRAIRGDSGCADLREDIFHSTDRIRGTPTSGRQKIAGTLAARRQKVGRRGAAPALEDLREVRRRPRPPALEDLRRRGLERPPRQVGGRGAPPAPADVGHFGAEPDLVELQTQLRDARLRRVPRERVARRQAAARGGRRPRARRARPGVRGVEGLGLRGLRRYQGRPRLVEEVAAHADRARVGRDRIQWRQRRDAALDGRQRVVIRLARRAQRRQPRGRPAVRLGLGLPPSRLAQGLQEPRAVEGPAAVHRAGGVGRRRRGAAVSRVCLCPLWQGNYASWRWRASKGLQPEPAAPHAGDAP